MIKDHDYSEFMMGLSKPDGWDFELWKHMTSKPRKERLIIAGALIAAELDRLNFQ